MPLNETSGNVTTDAYGGGTAVEPVYIEQIFSTWLYTGTGAAQTITNGIDLSTKGGLLWIKDRTAPSTSNQLFDSARGTNNYLNSDNSNAAIFSSRVSSFDLAGFTLTSNGGVNTSGDNYASWTFRKQPKFFDVVTWTGTGVDGQVINHSLGVKPSVIIVKRTDTTSNWQYNDANDNYLLLNTTAASAGANRNGGWIPQYSTTSTTLTTQNYSGNSNVNASGGTYVAYLFAHNAGGFGLTGTDNVISCGSYTGNGSATGPTVPFGYEPQWVMVKNTSAAGYWYMLDSMRGMSLTASNELAANSTAAENGFYGGTAQLAPTATGFQIINSGTQFNTSGQTYIYIAIRRGPMKVPTDATKVFSPVARSGTSTVASVTSLNFPPDAMFTQTRNVNYVSNPVFDRLRGAPAYLVASQTNSENSADTDVFKSFNMNGVTYGNDVADNGTNKTGKDYINWFFGRAPSFMDVVCYTGTGSATTFSHNLGAVPQLMLVKSRSTTGSWWTYSATISNTDYLRINTTSATATNANIWNSTTPTSSVFTIGTYAGVNTSGTTYVAYLFATASGVSKVGSFTGNGTTQTINCGFAGGARFVLIKRTDAAGGWYVYDTARGMTTLTDPYLFMNDYVVETATLGSVTTVTTGFALNSSILADININSATYIFLAIA